MELTPKTFRDVQFREKLRGGYHPEDVDEFLEQAAQGLEALQEQLRQATERVQRAEQVAAEATATDEALKRMLLFAQRTADSAISEAREAADQMLSEARAQAQSMMADAEERGRREYESGLAEGRASMERADEALRRAQQEVEGLRGWVDMHKVHLLGVLRDAQARVEGAGLLSEPPTLNFPARDGSGGSGGSDSSDSSDSSAGGDEEGEHFSGTITDDPSSYGGAHGEVSEEVSEEQTGEWDPHYLQGLQHANGDPQAAEPPPPPGSPYGSYNAAPGETLGYTPPPGPLGAGPGDPQPAIGPDAAPVPMAAVAPASPPGGAENVAFDERALDTFFSDQDLDQGRGGFFRRRQ
jgi:cell division initiation protein